MTRPNCKPCPTCGGVVTLYIYDGGGRRAECDDCEYTGPNEQSLMLAVRSHNYRAQNKEPSHG